MRNQKRVRPSSDPATDFSKFLGDMGDDIKDLQSAAIRGLPKGWFFRVEKDGLVVVDSTKNRKAKIDLDWINDG